MIVKYLIPLLLIQPVFAQTVIHATSKHVTIDDEGDPDRSNWTLSPKTRPDIYTADRTRKTKWVTFRTDIDSIRVKVKPGSRYDFIVLLNGKDSCYTQIASAIPPEGPRENTNDTIPFTLTAYNAIRVTTIINDTDTVRLYFDVGSFGFRLLKDVKMHLGKVTKLQMGSLIWNNPEILTTSLTAHDMDGRFSWDLFEGKTVELDYDHNLLIIHSRLPKRLKGYVRSKMEFIQSYVCVKGVFDIDHKKYPGDFLFDTGSDQAIILDSTWVARRHFPQDLRLIKSSVLRDPRGVQYKTKVVVSPLFRVNDFAVSDVPTLLLGSKNPTGFEVNFLGNGLLKRFNIVLDFENDYVYLKPNKLYGAPS